MQVASPATGGRERIAIVGGGMLGLGLARALAPSGANVSVFEAAPAFGGLAATWQLGGVEWDRHYHVILASDAHLRRLLDDLGLGEELVLGKVGTGFYSGGRFHPMNGAVDFLRFPPLGLIDKFRLGATILLGSRITDGTKLERVSVEAWLRKYSGNRTFERIWRPLLRAKLGERYRDASAAFIWAIIVRLYAARRAGLGAERFGYVRGGYRRIIEALARDLSAKGVELVSSARVTSVERAGAEVAVTFADATVRTFDRVVVTLPAPRAAALVPALNDDERDRLASKTYGGIVCASLLLDQPLGPYYVTNLTDEWVPFSAVIDMGTIVDRAEWGGRSIVYLPKYVAPDDPLFEASDDAIREAFLGALERMYPSFSRERVRAFAVSRVREVFAIATLGYSGHLPPIATSVPGVYTLNSAHIVNGTLNVNETLQLVERGVAALGPLNAAAGTP